MCAAERWPTSSSAKAREAAKAPAGKASRSVGAGGANGGKQGSAECLRVGGRREEGQDARVAIADAGHPGRQRADRRRLDPRSQVRRLPHGLPDRPRRRARLLAQRQGLDGGAAVDRRLAAAPGRRSGVARRRDCRRRRRRDSPASSSCKTRCPIRARRTSAISSSICSTRTATICAASR